MKTIQIPIKYNKEDTIYTIKQSKIKKICEICEGNKTIEYNGKNMRCPECGGTGEFTSNKLKYTICDEPFKISTIKISINNNEDISIKYKGHCGFSSLSRAEENLFATKQEALEKCEELNKQRVAIDIDNIIISDEFKSTNPSIEKIQERLDYYNKNKKFMKEIVINKDCVLVDGYITYLLARMFNFEYIKVVVEE